MNDDTKKYWTDDPELVEKYILNKISAEEKKRLDAEIADCEPCKAKLQEELEIAAGIRHYGRDILKARLRKKLRRERATQFFNYQYVGLAAAVVIIAIGLGAYQIWFSDLVAPKKFHQQEIVFKQSEDSAAISSESSDEERKSEAGKPEDEHKESDQRLEQSSSQQKMEIAEQGDLAQSAPAVSSVDQKQSLSGAAGKSDDLVGEGSKSESTPSAIWLIGQIVIVNESVQDNEISASKIQKEKDTKFSEQRRPKTNSQSLETITLNKKVKENNIILQQRSMKDLPIGRSQQRTGQQREIETLFERTDKGIQLTLYDDSINESDMKDAIVERVSEDSIVVSLPNQRIAYRLPSGWNSTSSGRR
ncbi:MAG: hypothetical protein Q8L88_07480 [Bacteroidota bacterium]|nr:hypothetical protein [Bacteroidota bacterium]